MKKFLKKLALAACLLAVIPQQSKADDNSRTVPKEVYITYSVGGDLSSSDVSTYYNMAMTKELDETSFRYTITGTKGQPVYFRVHANSGWDAHKHNVYTNTSKDVTLDTTDAFQVWCYGNDIGTYCVNAVDDAITILIDFSKYVNDNKIYLSYEQGFHNIYLRGSFTGDNWAINDSYKMKTSDGVIYTLESITIPAESSFKFSDANWKHDYNFGPSTNGSALTTGETTLTQGEYAQDFSVSEAMQNITLTLNTSTKVLTVVQVITAGIEGVEAEAGEAEAEYFTVAGVRVDNPATPGLYLRRQGNKTSKVVIR